jgi:hypothetical protein
MPVIGFLHVGSPEQNDQRVAAYCKRLTLLCPPAVKVKVRGSASTASGPIRSNQITQVAG